ncbi:RDD family protein [Tahibacter harae]|uniref:RDD family protein n=1 Tax=Tahibacter harae TaxID=2963937 RepID=A0ABT1QUH8_9GAMM|nr:RDD family protein [Tahibacter harae]MCQ4165946.1 RDD family protein [Tahibacter harae]
MENTKHALVLTGIVLPGHAAESVWPALASYFRMEPDKVSAQLVPRAPVTLKESDDLGKLQGLQDGLRGIGAESEIHVLDERGSLFAVVGGKPRGPVPHAFIERKVATGDWSGNVEVAKVGENNWGPFSRLSPPPAAAVPPPPPAPPAFRAEPPPGAYQPIEPRAAAAPPVLTAAEEYSPYANPTEYSDPVNSGEILSDEPLPAGEAIHAGFWRRTSAYLIDSFLIGIANFIVSFILGFAGAMTGSAEVALGVNLLASLVGIVIGWLYFAKLEAGDAQATLGKRAMQLKVVNEFGNRISFARATGRHFGKILSGIILGIGFFMVGFTERKQGLHDMLASTFVVFDTVQPGQPLPTDRSPMPWYGWLINIVCLSLPPLFFLAAMAFVAAMR